MITYPDLGNRGRLGNQLWQIASTLGVADTCNDSASFPEWAYQKYFNMPNTYFEGLSGTSVYDTIYTSHMPPEARPYVQDYALFHQIDSRVRHYFKPSRYAMGLLLHDARIYALSSLPRPVVAVHVRRGDNAYEGEWKAQYHPLRPIEYYKKALTLKSSEANFNTVAVFSDDIEWCKWAFAKPSFAGLNMWYFEDGVVRPKEHEPAYAHAPVLDWIDFFAMTMCEHHIISNSTYAWWAAFLSDSPAPVYNMPWYGPALNMIDTSLMFPPHWVPITTE